MLTQQARFFLLHVCLRGFYVFASCSLVECIRYGLIINIVLRYLMENVRRPRGRVL